MKNVFLFAAAAFLMACNSSPAPVVNTNATANSTQRSEKTETVTAHSTENQIPTGANANSNARTKWTQSGDPIDTKQFDTAIASAEKSMKAKPDDKAAKDALADAYLKRATALTGARQYAAALGDYRRVLKYDPENDTAKEWVNQIVGIYNGMNREAPPEGQEPGPLPYKPEK